MSRNIFYAVLILAGLGLWLMSRPAATPAPPQLADALTTPGIFKNASASADHYRAQIVKHPESVDAYVGLAHVYLEEAALSGREAHYLPRVETLLDEALARNPSHVQARVLKAELLAKLHQFEDARALAETLISENPHFAHPYGILVDALVETGAYPEAVAAADEMVRRRPSLAAYARISYLRELHGDTEGALKAMHLAAEAGVTGRADRAWALTQLGHLYLAEAQTARALTLFEGVLQESPGYTDALAGMAHVYLVNGLPETAVGIFRSAYDGAPKAAYLEGLSEAYLVLGDAARADSVDQHVLAALNEEAQFGSDVDMELADFMAERGLRLDEALHRAQANYERRPGHRHTLETYAWALHKSGRSQEAIPYIEQALHRLPQADGKLDYRAAQIYEAVGQTDRAEMLYQSALDNGLHLESPSAAMEIKQKS